MSLFKYRNHDFIMLILYMLLEKSDFLGRWINLRVITSFEIRA